MLPFLFAATLKMLLCLVAVTLKMCPCLVVATLKLFSCCCCFEAVACLVAVLKMLLCFCYVLFCYVETGFVSCCYCVEHVAYSMYIYIYIHVCRYMQTHNVHVSKRVCKLHVHHACVVLNIAYGGWSKCPVPKSVQNS